MAELSTRGYVKNPQTKKTQAGKPFATYGLNCKQKGYKDTPDTYAYFNVTDWNAEVAPEEGSYASVKGWFTVREFQKDGVKRQSLDINAQEVEISPPKEGSGTKPTPLSEPGKDPWE